MMTVNNLKSSQLATPVPAWLCHGMWSLFKKSLPFSMLTSQETHRHPLTAYNEETKETDLWSDKLSLLYQSFQVLIIECSQNTSSTVLKISNSIIFKRTRKNWALQGFPDAIKHAYVIHVISHICYVVPLIH